MALDSSSDKVTNPNQTRDHWTHGAVADLHDPRRGSSPGNQVPETTARTLLPTVELVDPAHPETVKPTQSGSSDVPKPQKTEAAADAINYALHGGSTKYTGLGADGSSVLEILRNSTEAEKKQIDQAYRTKYGVTLESELRDQFSGAKLDEAINILNRKDDGRADDAGRIHKSLIERSQLVFGRSNQNIERDLRDTVSTLNSKQIGELDADYQRRYGTNLNDALLKDPKLSPETREALSIYLKGTDKRTADDSLKLIDLALKAKSTDMLGEAVRTAPPEVRQQFMQAGGDEKLKAAFEDDPSTYQRSKQMIEQGRISTAQLVRDNSSVLGDDEAAIDLALKGMSPKERAAYLEGKEWSEKPNAPGVSAHADSVAFYKELHQALSDAGNSTEVKAWESLIANPTTDNLINKLSKHRGTIYDSSTGDVVSTVENMSKEDWQHLKSDPKYLQEVKDLLGDFLSDKEMKRVADVLDKKLAANTFDDSKVTGRRPILDTIGDHTYTLSSDKPQIVDAVMKMTPEEQKQYREDKEFREKLDKQLAYSLGANSSEHLEAQGLTGKILRGEKPEAGLAETLYQRSSGTADGAQALRDLETAIAKDPTLKDRLLHPTTDEDKRIIDALNRALAPQGEDLRVESGFNYFVKPMLENGSLPVEKRFELNNGNPENMYKDILKVTPEEKTQILSDSKLQNKLLVDLTDEQRSLALNILKQGGMEPVDRLRADSLAGNVDGMKQTLTDLKSQDLQTLRQQFAAKYGDLTGQVLDRLSGSDKTEVAELLRDKPTSDREAFNESRNKVYLSQDGFGRWVVKNLDGTSYQLDQALSDYAARMTEASAKFSQLSPEEQSKLQQQVKETLEEYKKSETSVAAVATDALIAAGTISATILTGGTASLALLAAVAAGGAGTKVGVNALIMGADYETSIGHVASDATTGAANAAINLFGAAQAGRLIGLGTVAARETAGTVLKTTGTTLVREGQEQVLEKGLVTAVRTAIANGATTVDEATIGQLVSSVAVKGQETALMAQLTTTLNQSIEQTAGKVLMEMTLNAGAAGGGNAGVTFLDSTLQGNTAAESGERALAAGLTGAIFGATMTGAIRFGREVINRPAPKISDNPVKVAKVSNIDASIDVNARPSYDGSIRLTPDRIAELEKKFPHLEGDKLQQAIELAKGDLKAVTVSPHFTGADGRPLTVLGTLELAVNKGTLTREEADSILKHVAIVREKHASIKGPDGQVWPDQYTSAQHAFRELGANLQLGMMEKTEPGELFQSVLSALYSDADKAAKFTPGELIGGTFYDHHLRGADALIHEARESGIPKEQIRRMEIAIQTHQETPKAFMAKLYTFPVLEVLGKRKAAALDMPDKMAEYERLNAIYQNMTEPIPGTPVRQFKALVGADDSPIGKVRDSQGRWYLDLSKDERSILELAGVDQGKWYVSVNPDHPDFNKLPVGDPRRFTSQAELDEARLQFRINERVKGADCVENYNWGIAKYVEIRGADTIFPDTTVWKSIDSVVGPGGSWEDSVASLHGPSRDLMIAEKENFTKVLNDPQHGLKATLDQLMIDHPKLNGIYHEKAVVFPRAMTDEESAKLATLRQSQNIPELSNGSGLSIERRIANIENWVKNLPEEVKQLQYQYRQVPGGEPVTGRLTDEQIMDIEKTKIVRDYVSHWFRSKTSVDGVVPDRANFSPVTGG